MELPSGYSLVRGQSLQEIDLIAPNGKTAATFAVEDDPRDVALIAYSHDSQVSAQIAYVERLLGRGDGRRSA